MTTEMLAKDIMTPNVKSVPENWTMHEFAKFLSDNEISGSPVVNDTGDVIGIATLKDIADFHLNKTTSDNENKLSEEEAKEARRLKQFIFTEMMKVPVEVRDIMSPIVFSIDENAAIKDVAKIMMNDHLHRIFVTRNNKVSGIITTYDLLKLITE